MRRHFKLIEETPLEALSKQFKSGSRQQRWEAVEELGGLADPAAVEVVLVALKDSDGSLRWRAAQALGRLGDPRAIDPLIAMLRDDTPAVREHAARALGALRARRAAPYLQERVQDPDMDVCQAAREALQQLGVRPDERTAPASVLLDATAARPRRSSGRLTATLSALALLAFLGALVANLFLATRFHLGWVGGLALAWLVGVQLLGAGLNAVTREEGTGTAILGVIGLLVGAALLAGVIVAVIALRVYAPR